MSSVSQLDFKLYWMSKLRWLAIFFQSVLLLPGFKLGYVDYHFIPHYLITTFCLIILNTKLVSYLIAKEKLLITQLIGDLAAFTILIHLSGKMENPFWPLIYLHAGLAAILLRPKEDYYFLPFLILSMLTVHFSSYSFHTALLYVIVPQWIILLTTWSLTRALGLAIIKQQEKIARLERKDQKINKLKSVGALAAGILHEIGTPLNTVRLKVDKLSGDEEFTGKDLDYLDRSLQQCEETISKLNSAQQEMVSKLLTNLDLSKYITDYLMLFSKRHPEIKVSYSQSSPTIAAVATNSLSLVLDIILENASEAKCTELEIKITESESNINLFIHDNGPGFNSFIIENFGAPYTSTKGRGRGLGLFSAKMNMEAMNGEILIENTSSGGSVELRFQKESV